MPHKQPLTHPWLRASILLTLLLAACGPQAPLPAVAPNSGPSVATSQSPTPSPSLAPAPAWLPSESPWVEPPTPRASAPSCCGNIVVLHGSFYDLEGHRTEDESLVRVEGVEPNQGLSGSTKSSRGSYVFNHIPGNAWIRLSASRPGFAPRSFIRLHPLVSGPSAPVDFGPAPDPQATWPNVAMALTPQPEVSQVTLLDGAKGVRIQLSEALDEANRARFFAALRLLPANEAAASGATGDAKARDLTELPPPPLLGAQTSWPYAWRPDPKATGPNLVPWPWTPNEAQRDAGASEATARGQLLWNAAGDVATWSWGALPPGAGEARAKHQLALVAGPQGIQDPDGFPMGTGASGSLTAEPAPGQLLHLAFWKEAAASAPPLPWPQDAASRWAWVHRSAMPLRLSAD